MFHSFQKLMPRAAHKMGIGREFLAIQICVTATQLLKETFVNTGPYKIRAESFKSGLLTISAPTSAYSQEIAMRKEKLINDINEKMGKKVVKDLKTLLKS